MQDEYLIQELADEAGLSPRTIRYYQQEGLLPEPESRGKFAYYNADHLERLKLIQELKKSFLPLKEIREHLNSLNSQQVKTLLESLYNNKSIQITPVKVSREEPVDTESDTASEYIARLLPSRPNLPLQESPVAPYQTDRRTEHKYIGGSPSESWRHIKVTPWLVILIKDPLSPRTQKRVEDLIKFARALFSDDK